MRNSLRPRWPISMPIVPLLVLLVAAARPRCGRDGPQRTIVGRPDAPADCRESCAAGVLSRTLGAGPAVRLVSSAALPPAAGGRVTVSGHVTPNAVAVIHVLTGMLTVVVVWVLSGQAWGRGRLGFLAALLVAVDPILLHQSAEVMTETLATLLCVLGLLALTQWSHRQTLWAGAIAGAVLGLAILCRPTFLIWAALCGASLIVVKRNWMTVVQVAVFSVALGAVLSPWGLATSGSLGDRLSRRLMAVTRCCWPTTRTSTNTCAVGLGAVCGMR